MTQNIDDVLKAIQAIVGDVEGIRAAPPYMTDKTPIGISVMSAPASGIFEQSPQGVLKGLHSVEVYVTVPRVDLPKSLKAIIPVGDRVAKALENNPTLLGSVTTFGQISYEFGMSINVGTAAAPAFVTGWVFTISDVKTLVEL